MLAYDEGEAVSLVPAHRNYVHADAHRGTRIRSQHGAKIAVVAKYIEINQILPPAFGNPCGWPKQVTCTYAGKAQTFSPNTQDYLAQENLQGEARQGDAASHCRASHACFIGHMLFYFEGMPVLVFY